MHCSKNEQAAPWSCTPIVVTSHWCVVLALFQVHDFRMVVIMWCLQWTGCSPQWDGQTMLNVRDAKIQGAAQGVYHNILISTALFVQNDKLSSCCWMCPHWTGCGPQWDWSMWIHVYFVPGFSSAMWWCSAMLSAIGCAVLRSWTGVYPFCSEHIWGSLSDACNAKWSIVGLFLIPMLLHGADENACGRTFFMKNLPVSTTDSVYQTKTRHACNGRQCKVVPNCIAHSAHLDWQELQNFVK